MQEDKVQKDVVSNLVVTSTTWEHMDITQYKTGMEFKDEQVKQQDETLKTREVSGGKT